MFVFQEAVNDVQVIDDVVEIIVGNEIITDLTDPIRIDFHHDRIPVSCVCFFVYLYWELQFIHKL